MMLSRSLLLMIVLVFSALTTRLTLNMPCDCWPAAPTMTTMTSMKSTASYLPRCIVLMYGIFSECFSECSLD
ncbi:hypothetical protein BDV26DRAFT_259276 [Aspergillus bertholletiae]|uniref:Secreted protein n=1 Tax=Aspergillus bertholletiae TaxID=1226010 RepID=A0A5N7BCQ3_9EURO|nr:hypothetical protein BDV26DRAFT_259276 [Aspergillus bertholletiae]